MLKPLARVIWLISINQPMSQPPLYARTVCCDPLLFLNTYFDFFQVNRSLSIRNFTGLYRLLFYPNVNFRREFGDHELTEQ